jgi:osmotically-inducible protein OsmY
MQTDAQLQQAVAAQLLWEPALHAGQIGVRVKDGVVTLAGEVECYAVKWSAERAAQRVVGLQARSAGLKVRLPAQGRRADAEIARAARDVVVSATSMPQGAIKVHIKDGWITLTGRVDWPYQRQQVADGMRYLRGVTGVSNRISVEPDPQAAAAGAVPQKAISAQG